MFLKNTQLFASHWWMDWWTGVVWCELLVNYCNVFISCLDSRSDGTHSLQRIHWRASDVMLHFSKSDEETNSSTSWITRRWVCIVWILYRRTFLCLGISQVFGSVLSTGHLDMAGSCVWERCLFRGDRVPSASCLLPYRGSRRLQGLH